MGNSYIPYQFFLLGEIAILTLVAILVGFLLGSSEFMVEVARYDRQVGNFSKNVTVQCSVCNCNILAIFSIIWGHNLIFGENRDCVP